MMFRLKKIHIDTYKNISGDYVFSNNNGYVALIGLNGSGKSNLLEAISIIFDGLINNGGSGIPFDYNIEYELNGHLYSRKKHEAKKDGIKCESEELVFPTNLIACYSGEDLRLWHVAFENYYMGYFNEAVKKSYSFPTFLYINKYCWEIALIALVCSDKPSVKEFLLNTLKINNPQDVEIDFNINDSKKDIFNAHTALNWFKNITQDGLESINLNTIATTGIYVGTKQIPESEKARYIFSFLYLLSQPKKSQFKKDKADKTKKKGNRNNIDKLINLIKLRVNIDGHKIDFDDLSEGEKKLILIECITKVLGDENSLVLLDEPDAHTHIAMKKTLLKLISEFEGQTIMTTHSPMFVKMIQDDNQDNLFYIENGEIKESRNNLIRKLSNDTLTVLDGTLYSVSNSYLLVEGKSDVNCIKAAIKKFPEYSKLDDISIISFNGADEAKELFEQAFSESMESVKNLVFLFDYDSQGLKGWNGTEEIIKKYPDKCHRIFYQKNYSEDVMPTNIKPSDSILMEDLVKPEAYQPILDKIHKINSFHQLHSGGNITEKPIKDYIENKCKTFTEEQLIDFKPVLNKLLSLFNLE